MAAEMSEPDNTRSEKDRALETGTAPKACIACGSPLVAAECEACAEAHRIFDLALAWTRANAEELARADGGEPDLWYAICAYFELRPAEEALIEAHLERLRKGASRSGPEQA